MLASISSFEMNSLLRHAIKPGISLEASRIADGRIDLVLKTKVLIKEISINLSILDIRAEERRIEACLEGLPEWMLSFARNQGWLNLPGLSFSGTHLTYDLSSILPAFIEIESLSTEEDELRLILRLK